MPPRGARKAVPRAVSESSQEVQPGTNKRKIDADRALSSPRWRSKRVKSAELPENQEHDTNGSAVSVKEEIKEKKNLSEAKHQEIAEQAPETKKATTRRRSKKEQEAETMPLRPRAKGLRMYVGAHVSAAKGVFNAVNNSMHIGGNAFALFLKSQRKWDNPPLQNDHRDTFRKLCIENDYDAAKHVLPHGSYLVNLAQEDKAKAKQAYDSFIDDLRRCEALGIKLYNFHPGSANQSSLPDALSRLAKALTNALSATSTVIPVLETMCGHGSTIGGSLTEFRDLLALIPKEHHARIGICIDTCHSFAAGYDLASPAGFQAFMKEFEDVVGIKYLRALHLNDSKAPRGSKRDLHANIGTGFLGLRAFHNVMNEPRFEDLPMILETPIDRPATSNKAEESDEAASDDGSTSKKPNKKKPQRKPATAKAPLVQDFSVWAREIELLESLIGMDPEGPEFLKLETQLAEEGRETREKHMDQYKRKIEAEEKKKTKSPRKTGQKTLTEMMGNSKRKTRVSQKVYDEGSEDEGCQSH